MERIYILADELGSDVSGVMNGTQLSSEEIGELVKHAFVRGAHLYKKLVENK